MFKAPKKPAGQDGLAHALGAICVLIGFSIGLEASAQNCVEWQRVAISGRAGHAMAYDSDRDVTVLFGGPYSAHAFFSKETWELNGDAATWAFRTNEGPSERAGHAMVYDAKRKVTVLFGGVGPIQLGSTQVVVFGDTWEWDGSRWSLRTTLGPSPRAWYAMSYDSRRGVVVMFGGHTQANGGNWLLLNDTWEWDGRAWTQVADNGPPTGDRMAYDERRGVCVLLSKSDGVTWEWNGTLWTRREIQGPGARAYYGIVYDSARGAVMLFGGADPSTWTYFNDTWQYDGSEWTLRSETGPQPRMLCEMTFDRRRNVAQMFGGEYNLTDLWEWDGLTWTQRSRAPALWSGQSMTFDSVRQVTYMLARHADQSPELWEWDGAAWEVKLPLPEEFINGRLAYDSIRNVLVLLTSVTGRAQTWEWNGQEWMLRASTNPGTDSEMVFDSGRGVVVLFRSNQTWEWDGQSWTLRTPTISPPSRQHHCLAYDPISQRSILAGGRTNESIPTSLLQDTWAWDGDNWTYLGEDETVSSGQRMMFDASRGRVLRFGGQPQFIVRSYELVGDQWRVVEDSDLGWIWSNSPVVAFDSARNVAVMFARNTGLTWEFRATSNRPGDLTCDRAVNAADLLAVINAWGPCAPPPEPCPADIAPAGPPAGDGTIGVPELLMIINNWGP